jgi:hypothetical protein
MTPGIAHLGSFIVFANAACWHSEHGIFTAPCCCYRAHPQQQAVKQLLQRLQKHPPCACLSVLSGWRLAPPLPQPPALQHQALECCLVHPTVHLAVLAAHPQLAAQIVSSVWR